MASKVIKLQLTQSLAGRPEKHKACAIGLGLRRPHHCATVIDTPENRGMINKISYMLKVEGA